MRKWTLLGMAVGLAGCGASQASVDVAGQQCKCPTGSFQVQNSAATSSCGADGKVSLPTQSGSLTGLCKSTGGCDLICIPETACPGFHFGADGSVSCQVVSREAATPSPGGVSESDRGGGSQAKAGVAPTPLEGKEQPPPAEGGDRIEYVATLGPADHCDSAGKPLPGAPEIFQQDRANYHRFGLRDADDQSDPMFGAQPERARLARSVTTFLDKPTRATMKQMVVSRNPKVKVIILSATASNLDVWIQLLDAGKPFSGCH